MTRRIVTAILIIAWGVLLLGGAAAYLATRAILLAELDESLLAKAASLLQFAGVTAAGQPVVPAEDRFILRNEHGQTLARPPAEREAFQPPQIISRNFVRLADGRRMRSITVNAVPAAAAGEGQGPVTLVYSTPAGHLDQTLNRLVAALAGIGVGSGLLAAWAAFVISRAALAPLHQTAQTIGGIDEKRLDRRIDCGSLPIELRPMGEQLNQMLQRLEQVFAQRRQFLADAAHELRTPVAAMLTRLEVTLRRPRDAAALTSAMEESLASAKLLRRLVETLLEQVRSEEVVRRRPPEPVDVPALLRDCAVMGEALGAEKQVRVVCLAPERLQAVLHPERLRSIVMNLMANAVQHNRPGGMVELACGAGGKGLWITVSDTGAGIDETILPHVFEPFFRGDPSHDAQAGHLGLGLFLVRSHVTAMDGTCEVRSRLGEGTCFRVEVPCPLNAR